MLRSSHRSTVSALACLVLGSAAMTACVDTDPATVGDGDAEEGDGDSTIGEVESTLELYSWWVAGHEAVALDALLEIYGSDYPEVEIINAAQPEELRLTLAERLASDEPPDTFQAVSGVDLLSYVESGKMAPITDMAEEFGWFDVFPPALLEIISSDGELYGVPVNIERDNNLYFNIGIFEDAGVDPPSTLEDFYAACETLKEAGITPLAVPAAGWSLSILTFESLLPVVAGGDFYWDFFQSNVQVEDVESAMRSTFTELAKVLACSNVAVERDNWNRWDVHADQLHRGEAAMIVMGDWTKGYLESGKDWEGNAVSPLVAGFDFGSVAALGSEGYVVFNSAVFGLPKYADHPNAAKAFLKTFASAEGQEAFNLLMGTVPANVETRPDAFDDMVADQHSDFAQATAATNKLLPGIASLLTWEQQLAFFPYLLVFAVGGERAFELDPVNVPNADLGVEALDVDYAVEKMMAAYDVLQD